MTGAIRCRAPARFIATLVTLVLLPACATLAPPDCASFEQARKQTDYTTRYRRSSDDTALAAHTRVALPRGSAAAVWLYRMRLSTDETRPCTHITIHKELYLQRVRPPRPMLEEIREMYASDGTLIATKSEDLSAQLDGGMYTASVPLPIPKAAPPGYYRIVSKITVTPRSGGDPTALATTAVVFRVLPP